MKISIIIPNFNGSSTIMKTIKSIYGSTGLNRHTIEVIVVDDNSGDDAVFTIEKNYPLIKVIRQQHRSGAAAARNAGIINASGNILLFIDNDAWLNSSTLSVMINSLDGFDIIFPKIVYESGQLMYPLPGIESAYPHISCSFLIRKDSLDRLDEHFDEYYGTYLEDYDFFMRCRTAGLEAKYAQDARVIHANKEKGRDYSRRYYLETRNILYGKLKLGSIARRSGLYNPFTLRALAKAFIFGMLNFAWFSWQDYDRASRRYARSPIFPNSNKFFLFYCKAIADVLKDLPAIREKAKALRKFYIKR